ncbi:MAG: glycosyltransferase [Candidatus Eisenbacteria bacterium]
MRILFVNSLRSMGGGERWLIEVNSALVARGHETAFAVRQGGELARLLRAEGRRTLELPMRGDGDVLSMANLSRWIRELRTELVSVNVQRAVRIGAPAARAAGVRAVVERRGLLFPLKPTALNRFIYGRMVSRVIANCDAIRRDLVGTGLVTIDRVTVIPNGIDSRRVRSGGGAALRDELGLDAAAPVVAVIGRLGPDKGHRVAIKAFAELLRVRPEARLLIAGAGHLEEDLTRFAASLVPSGAAMLLGHRDDVDAVLDAADVVLVTSFREGMPHVVLEAMAAGTPIVATAVAGIPEMIEDGKEGILIPVGSHTAAAKAVGSILADAARAGELAGAARRRVETDFGLETMVDRVERCFEREIETGGRPGGASVA